MMILYQHVDVVCKNLHAIKIDPLPHRKSIKTQQINNTQRNTFVLLYSFIWYILCIFALHSLAVSGGQ